MSHWHGCRRARIPIIPVRDLLVPIPGTLAILVIGYSESMSVAFGFADRHHYQVKPNQELAALGMSSIFGGLFHGFITGGGASQSAANDRAVAKTQVAAIMLAVLAFLSAVLLMPLFLNLPQAVLGAIVISAVMGRLAPNGVFVAMDWTTGVAEEPGLVIYRPSVPILFVNTDWELYRLREAIAAEPNPPFVVVLDLGASSQLDIAGLNFLGVIQRDLTHQGRELWLSEVNQAITDIIGRSDLAEDLSP